MYGRKGHARFCTKRSLQSIVLTVFLLAGMILSPAATGVSSAAGTTTANTTYFNFAEALQKSIYFYDAEKCGPGITGGRLEWRGDCHVGDSAIPFKDTSLSEDFIAKYKDILDPDGDGLMDLHGGFHDAGDHVRFGKPQAYAASTLGWGYYEFKDAFVKTSQDQHMMEILKWFSDMYLRSTFLDKDGKVIAYCYMVGEGTADHTYWGAPELYPESIPRPADFATADAPASDQAALASAALTLMYLNYKDIDATYANKCLTYGKALYDFGRNYRGLGKDDGFYNSGGDDDALSWAAVWLYTATGNMDYIHHIDSVDANGIYTGYMKRIIKTTANSWQNIWVHCWDVVWGGVFTKLATLFPDNQQFVYFSRWNLEYWTGGKVPHEDTKDTSYLVPTAAGYGMINTWGSARYNCGAQLCAVVYQKYFPSRTDFTDWAKGQMEYLMGNNPMGYSYIVGYGLENGVKSVQHPHHRAAHGSKTNSMLNPENHRHTLWGALAGGPDSKDVHVDVTTDFVYNEVAVDYNAAFVGALAGEYLQYGKGNQVIPDFPPKEGESDWYYAEAKLEQENKERTQVTVTIHNESAHAPHYETQMSCRYFFNIGELVASGQSIDDVKFAVMYDEQNSAYEQLTQCTGPFKWDDAGTYYMELAWPDYKIYGKRELHFALVAGQDSQWTTHWDPTNDWSRNGITAVNALNKYIPVYLNGKKVYGEEPPKLGISPTPSLNPNITPSPVKADIQVLYKCGDKGDTANTVRAVLKVKNTGTTNINLSDVKLRYWYTKDGEGNQTFECPYALPGAANVKGNFINMTKPVTNADTCLEFSFSKDIKPITPGSDSGEIQFNFSKDGFTAYTQSNDYSFDATAADLKVNDKITAYYNNNLVFGTEPGGTLPTVTPPAVTPTPTQTPTVTSTPISENDFNVETVFDPAKLVSNQMLTAKVTATNVSSLPYEGNQDVLLIVALYDKNNTMVNVSYISKGIAYKGTETLSAGFKLPRDITGMTVRSFMWDGTDLKDTNMIPLSNIVQLQ